MRVLIFIITLLIGQMLMSQNPMFDICPLKVGEEIPEATLMNEQEEAVQLADLVSEKPTVVIFYRGAWCGYCTQHLAELNDIKAEVEALGYQIIGVTVDRATKLEESKVKGKTEIEVYSDAKLEAIKAFGLDWQLGDEMFEKYVTKYDINLETWSGEDHHSLPVPAIYIIKEKLVEFQYVNPNYNTRLKPETLLAVLKTL